MRKYILFISCFLIYGCANKSRIPTTQVSDTIKKSSTTFQWPGNKKAAVCLTYDDGLDCHIDIAQPALDKFGFKGTFYCTGRSESLKTRMSAWRNLVAQGHELGNHTLYHPCTKAREGRDTFDWVLPEYDLANYSMSQIMQELRLANILLNAVDGKERRTYAYTCSDKYVGGKSFVDSLYNFFPAARNDGPLPESMKDVNLFLMPSKDVAENSGKEMIRYLEEARDQGTLATIMFHGVGDEYLKVSAQAHLELLEYLDKHRDEYYVDTFLNITDHIRKENSRLKGAK